MTQAVDSLAGTISRGYDGLGRVTSETTSVGTVSYTYDDAGRRATMSVPNQSQVSYTYDDADRLTQITQGSDTVSFTYDAADRRTSMTLPNGTVASYTYDAASQLTEVAYARSGTPIGNLTYTYDLNGNRTSVGGTLAATNLPAAVSTTAYNANNQLTTWGSASLSYDLAGNLTGDGAHAYAWSARTLLSSIDSGSTASFSYDAFGRRVSKTIGSTTTGFAYDGANVVQESSGGGTANSLTGGLDEVFLRTDSSGARSFLTDALGSTIALADARGQARGEVHHASLLPPEARPSAWEATLVAALTSQLPQVRQWLATVAREQEIAR